jgi:hypothetical protein
MREISPASNASAEEFYSMLPAAAQQLIAKIRDQKRRGIRPKPSTDLVDRSNLLTRSLRRDILDKIAELVDENLCGRAEMCSQFAELLRRSLDHLQLPARAVLGETIYYHAGKEIFRWEHAWVRVATR